MILSLILDFSPKQARKNTLVERLMMHLDMVRQSREEIPQRGTRHPIASPAPIYTQRIFRIKKALGSPNALDVKCYGERNIEQNKYSSIFKKIKVAFSKRVNQD
jgi:predicted secreted protein